MERKSNPPAFFKVFLPEYSTKQLAIPSAFTRSLSRALPDKVVLRDRYNNLWKVKVDKVRDKFYFSDGWTDFVEDNTIEGGDVLVFDYARPRLFDMRLYGPNACEKKGVGSHKLTKAQMKSVKEEEEKDDEYVEVRKEDEDGKEEDESSYDNNYVMESEMGDEWDEEILSNDCVACWKQETILKKKKLVKENEAKDNEYHEVKKEDEEGKEEEGECIDDNYLLESDMGDDWDEEIPTNDRVARRKKESSPGTSERPSRMRRVSDIYGAEIFRSGLVPVPANTYFITKTNVKRKAELYIPKEVVKYNNLNLPEKILLVDPEGRKFTGKLKIWKDGRRHYGGWRGLCRRNCVEEDDVIICEFIEGRQGLYINVSFVRADQV